MPGRGQLKRRLRTLSARDQDARRELGAIVLEMFRRDSLDTAALGERAAELTSLTDELDEVRSALGEPQQVREPTMPAVNLPAAGSTPPPAAPVRSPVESAPARPDLGTRVEGAEEHVRLAADAARRQAEEQATAEILALEQDLEREQERAAEAIENARRQLDEAHEHVKRAEEDIDRRQSEVRGAAAEWLRGQAQAMRREAERQIREELDEAGRDAERARSDASKGLEAEARNRIEALERQKSATEKALAEMTARSNEANARAHEVEATARRSSEESEKRIEARARERAEELAVARVRAREAELQREHEARAKALDVAERRLKELESEARATAERVAQAERKQSEGQAERTGNGEGRPPRPDAEIATREAAAAWLRGQVGALRREVAGELESERDRAVARADAAERRLRELESRPAAAAKESSEAAPAGAGVVEADAPAEQALLEPARLGRRRRPEPSPSARPPERPVEPPPEDEPKPVAVPEPGERVNLNTATFEQLREIGMSVTQSNRVLAYRERLDGFKSVDDLDAVPGIPGSFLGVVKAKLTA